MGKFNAAKVFESTLTAIKNAHNRLTELLDEGYLIEGVINGQKIKIEINTKVGIKITKDNIAKFGVDVDGDLFTTKISNSEDSNAWGVIGEIVVGGSTRRGLFLYNKSYSETDPFIIISGASLGNPFIMPQNNKTFIVQDQGSSHAYSMQLSVGQDDTSGQFTVSLNGGSLLDMYYNGLATQQEMQINVGTQEILITEGNGVERMKFKLNAYANNATAISSGGLSAGDLYRTGGDPDVVCIVH